MDGGVYFLHMNLGNDDGGEADGKARTWCWDVTFPLGKKARREG